MPPKTYTCRFFDDETGELAFEYSGIPADRLNAIAAVVKSNRPAIKAAGDIWAAADAVKAAVRQVSEVARNPFVAKRPAPARAGRR
jgi:hypothetical protein